MLYSNTLNLIQVGGGTQVKQGDLGSKFSYKLANEKDQELDDFDKEVAHIDLVLDDKIVFTTTATVDNSTVTFNIDKAIPVGLYFLEIKIRDYIFPSDKQTIIFVQSGAVAYDLKELVPNYDTNMEIAGILSDLSQKGIDISDLNRQLAQKANKDEVTNVMTPKGTLAYASLPTSGNQVGWYYYCPDGDGTHGAGNYVWNGTSWFFGGTGDEGYNLLKEDLDETTMVIESVNLYDEKTTDYSSSTTIVSDFIPVIGGKTIYIHRNNSSGLFGNYPVDKIEEYTNKESVKTKETLSASILNLDESTNYIRILQNKTYSNNICISYRLENEYSNHFHATIVPRNDFVSLSYFDTDDYISPILSILAAGKTVFVPKGIWMTSPFKLRDGDCIKGENTTYPFYGVHYASILAPKKQCDVFIDATNCEQINIDVALANVDKYGNYIEFTKNHLKLDNVHYSNFNLCIYGLIENGLTIKDSWECTFNKLYFRKVLKPNVICLRFKKSTVSGGNISQNYFCDIQAEGLGCTIIYSEDQSRVLHGNINSIMYEGTAFEPFERVSEIPTVNVPLIYLEHANNLHIGTIACNNLKHHFGKYNGVVYGTDNFITIGNGQYSVRLSIDNFLIDTGTNYDFVVVKAGTSINAKSYVAIKNLEYDHTHHHSVVQGGLPKLIVNDLLA